jgi:hypothetical protein
MTRFNSFSTHVHATAVPLLAASTAVNNPIGDLVAAHQLYLLRCATKSSHEAQQVPVKLL